MIGDGWAVAAKDLRLMARGRGGLVPMVSLGAVTLLVLAFALGVGGPSRPAFGGGVIWVAVFFAGQAVVTGGWRLERESGALEAYLLSPADPLGLYLGKLGVALIAMAAVAAVVVPLDLVLFGGAPPRDPLLLVASLGLGSLGFVAAGLLLELLGGAARGVDGYLGLVLLPLAVPDLLASVATTQSAWLGVAAGPWWRVLAGYDILFLALALILFEAALEVV